MRFILISGILLLIAGIASGQEPAYKHYTTKNGMPSYNYFYVGYTNDTLFISTDEVSLYSFNGIDFEKLKSPPSKYMYRDIHFLKKGYFMRNTMNHYWYRHLNGDWKTIPTPESNIIWKDTLLGFNADSMFYFDEDKLLWIFKKKMLNPEVNIEKYYPFIFHDFKNRTILTFKIRKPPELLYDIYADTFINMDSILYRCQGIINDELFYLNERNGFVKWKYLRGNNDIKKSINKSYLIENLFSSPFFIRNKFENTDELIVSNIIKQENSLNFFTFDTISGMNYSGTMNIPRANYQKINENLYFVGSFEGLYKINPNITFYSPYNSNINKNIRSIVKHNGKIWTGGYGSGFCKLNKDGFVKSSSDFQKGLYNNILNGGFALSDNEAWFFNEGNNTIFILKDNILNGYQIYSNGEKSWDKGFYIDTLNDGRLAFSLQYDNFGILDSVVENRVYITSVAGDKGIKHGNSWSFDQDKRGRVWLSRFTAGIAVYDMDKDTVISYDYNLDIKKSFGVISTYIDNYDKIWLGTTNGLYIVPHISDFDIYNKNIFDYAIQVELPNADKSLVSSIKCIDNYIAVGNKTGIFFIENNSKYDSILSKPIHQLIYGEDINGDRTEQNCMYYGQNRYLWVSTINGVLKIDVKALKLDTTQVKIQIDYIKNADNLLNISNNKIKINPVKRNLIICFKPYKNPSLLNNIYYDYTLVNDENDTISYQHRSKNNLFNVDYIPPDNYIFEIKAYKNGILQDRSSFEIMVPYTFGENPFIWLLGIILAFILLSIFLYYRKEHFKKLAIKEKKLTEIEKEKEELKVQTIVNAFNPHFINNSLHWIQSRYNEDPDTVKMISRLSYNIYDIFKKTRAGQAVHSLEEELKILENYIEIQKLRFGDSFSFILPDKEVIEKYKDLKLIVMQLQIHVENAIEHGIRNRTESSFVKLDITEKEKYIILSVTDDGVGRIKAKEIGSRGTQSGIKMLKQLYTIFNNNPNNHLKIYSYYQDEIFEKNGIKYGTKLIINIPKNFIFEIM